MYMHGVSFRPAVLDSYTEVRGQITNESGKFWDLVGIEMNFYGHDGAFLDKMYVSTIDFRAGQTRTFKQDVRIPLGEIARYEVLTISTNRIGDH